MKPILYRPHRLSSNVIHILGALALLGIVGMLLASSPNRYHWMVPSVWIFLICGAGWIIGMCIPIKPIKETDGCR